MKEDTHHRMDCGISRSKLMQLVYFIVCATYLCLLCGYIGHLIIRAESFLQNWAKNGTNVCSSKTSHSPLTILLWHWPFGKAYPLRGNVCLDLYNISACKVVDNCSDFSKANIVVFHHRELATRKVKLPLNPVRPAHQRWVWLSLESPENNGNLRPYSNLFNLTMSYRRDADITVPYGELQPQNGEVDQLPVNKTHLVCWVVSNFNSHHKRSHVYRQLSALVNITVYGRWMKAPLREAELLPTISRCYFYLAFENSGSKDYITEKLWRNAYQSGAVPLVLGARPADYRAVAPPNSFIHVDDFSSMKELVTYMKELASNRERYEEFFRWRQKWKVKLNVDWRERLCKICTQCLPERKVYTDLHGWNNV